MADSAQDRTPGAASNAGAGGAKRRGPFDRRRFWKQYRAPSGATPVRDEIMALAPPERAKVLAAMNDVAENGLKVARHLRNDIYEVRADGKDVIYRVLFATEGSNSQILLALEFFVKKSQKTPSSVIETAETRLGLHRAEGRRRTRRGT